MYKVIIVDDEEWTLKALRLIVDWSRFDMVIAGRRITVRMRRDCIGKSGRTWSSAISGCPD